MNKKRWISAMLIVTLTCGLGLTACGGTQGSVPGTEEAEVQRYAWPLGSSSPEDTVTQIYAEKFAEEVDRLSGGSMKISVYPNSVLGGDRELLESCKDGDIPFVVQNTAPQVTFMKDTAVFDMPALFETIDEVREHDGLTGLYNKAKYLEMAEKEFQSLDSIAIFNFDVNNLKKMNDQFGHEAGDKLIIKAANSFRKVTSNRVHAFRMGGDEFLLVAENISKTETDKIRQRWEEELARLNTAEDGIDCVVAVGVAYGEKEYDYAALLKLADERMYEDKKAKKKPGEEIR